MLQAPLQPRILRSADSFGFSVSNPLARHVAGSRGHALVRPRVSVARALATSATRWRKRLTALTEASPIWRHWPALRRLRSPLGGTGSTVWRRPACPLDRGR